MGFPYADEDAALTLQHNMDQTRTAKGPKTISNQHDITSKQAGPEPQEIHGALKRGQSRQPGPHQNHVSSMPRRINAVI